MSSENGSPAAAPAAGGLNGSANGHTRTVEQVEAVTIRFAGDSGDGMQLAGTQFTNASAILGNDIAPSPTSPPRSAPRPARSPASPASRSTSASHDIHTPGDELDALVAMNPAALKTNLKDLAAGRHPDRQHRRLRHQRPGQGRLQGQPARRRLAQGLPRHPRADQQAQPRGGRRVQAQPARGRPLQELLRPRPGLLAVRAAAGRRR